MTIRDIGFKSSGQSANVQQDFSVGTVLSPKSAAIGEGFEYNGEMMVYQSSSAGGFVNISANARSATSGSFQFPANETSASLYFSSNALASTGDYHRFPGFRAIAQSTGTIGSGIVELQYWNGSKWRQAPFSVIDNDGEKRFLPRGNRLLLDDTDQQIRFCQKFIETAWEKSDPIESGTDRYWARMIMSGSAYDTQPVFKNTLLHTDHVSFLEDGYQQYFGSARPERIARYSILDLSGVGATSQNMYLSDNLYVTRTGNVLRNGQSDSFKLAVDLPADADTGCLFAIELQYQVDNATAGDIDLTLRWAYQQPGDGLFKSSATAPTTFSREQSKAVTISIGNNEQQIRKDLTTSFSIEGAICFRVEPAISDTLWLSLQRSNSDSYGGDVNVLAFNIKYLAWNNGQHSTF